MKQYIDKQLIDDLRDFRKLASDYTVMKEICEKAAKLLEDIKEEDLLEHCARPIDWSD